jgi:glycolate oxidase iron-sulfur subunit
MAQIGKGTAIPIVHTVELLDWATGGPMPEALEEAGFASRVEPARVAAE